jgi:hypothetical protein
MSTADEVQFLELEIGEQPDMNGWYWTDKPRPSVPDGGGIQDVEGLHGPFKTGFPIAGGRRRATARSTHAERNLLRNCNGISAPFEG